MKSFSSLVLLTSLAIGGPAMAYDINGYAVSNFRQCGASNLPATIRELDRYFASPLFPEEARKNFLWSNSRVMQSDWAADSDIYENEETASGMDGVESGLLAYIASHGVTSRGVYSALTGGSSNGGCYIETSDIQMGDQFTRYAILSTCQGLKIGTGSSPTRPGEDPSVTWQDAAPGMNCIYGYSNNMADASGYGVYLLENLESGENTITQAFFSASRQVSYGNIPAALCYGADEELARYQLETAMQFTSDRIGGETSAWSYNDARRLAGTFSGVGKIAATNATMSVPANLKSKGVLRRNTGHGTLIFRTEGTVETAQVTLSDGEIIEVAEHFLATNGMAAKDWNATPTYIIDKGTKINGQHTIVGRTVVFHQSFAGLNTLGTAGSFEVTVNADGIVTGATLAPRTLSSDQNIATDLTDAHVNNAQAKALATMSVRFPQATLNIVNVRVGFDSSTYMEPKNQVNAVVEVEVEVSEGGFARIYIERIAI